MGRGRHRRHLRRPAAPVLRARAVERRRSDPEGAAVRPHRQRGQPRRGREGVLLPPRQPADARVHEVPVQVPAAGLPVRRLVGREPAAADRADPEYELLDTGIFDDDRYFDVFVEYAKAGPTTCWFASAPSTAAPRQRRCTCCPRCGSATTGRGSPTRPSHASSPTPAPAERARGQPSAAWNRSGSTSSRPTTLLFTENESNGRTAVGPRRPTALSRTASTTFARPRPAWTP